MKTVIELKGMEFRAAHGCYELEKTVGNHFTVDLCVEAAVDGAAREDDVRLTLNYLELYRTVADEMGRPSDILEHVALRIIRAVRALDGRVERVRVRVAKNAPPLGGKVAQAAVVMEG